MRGITEQKEYGDYQTPLNFSDQICHYLKNEKGITPHVVLEPTCGIGNFLYSATKYFDSKKYIGIDINAEYITRARERFSDNRVELINDDLFICNLQEIVPTFTTNDTVLILGNPPWVNNSTLSAINSENQPAKTNFKGMKGLDAITGSSNFDICEYIILQLINAFKGTNAIIAMLCKTIVARNILQELKRTNTPFAEMATFVFDAKKIFNVSADSCLLFLKLSAKKEQKDFCEVYNFEAPQERVSTFGYKNEKFYSTLSNKVESLDGVCCFEWRQGIKHDCSKIMELVMHDDHYMNGHGEIVEIEDAFVYPLVKSSDIKKCYITDAKRRVIVTQKRVREETLCIKQIAPLTWDYLDRNKAAFQRRKSSIYKGAPEYSIFGVGNYSFSNYKVGISGFYKIPFFSMLHNSKPIMMDDTCYFLSFNSFDDAYTAMLILNSQEIQSFLQAIAFVDSKRPYTKKVLERIDFEKCVSLLSFQQLFNVERAISSKQIFTTQMYKNFKKLVCAEMSEQQKIVFA